MIQLPSTAGPLASLVAKNVSRYSMQGIHVVSDCVTLRLEASDGHLAAIVQTPALVWEECDLIVPADRWVSAYQDLAKRKGKGILELAQDEGGPSLQVTAEDTTIMHGFTPLDGRFPNIDGILPATAALVKQRVKASLLISLLKAAVAVCPNQDDDAVWLLWWGENRPFGVMVKNEQLAFDALLMPLTQK